MPGQKPTHKLIADLPGEEKKSIELAAIWQSSKSEVTFITLKHDALEKIMNGADIKARIIPNRPKPAKSAAQTAENRPN